MTLGLHTFRRRQRTLARGVLALFCFVWLQAAIVPCAMAIVPDGAGGMAEEHCSWCPPGHDGHPASPEVAAERCAYPDGPQADTRADARLGAAAPLFVGPPLLVVEPVPEGIPVAGGVDRARPPERGGTPLSIAYCRYLI